MTPAPPRGAAAQPPAVPAPGCVLGLSPTLQCPWAGLSAPAFSQSSVFPLHLALTPWILAFCCLRRLAQQQAAGNSSSSTFLSLLLQFWCSEINLGREEAELPSAGRNPALCPSTTHCRAKCEWFGLKSSFFLICPSKENQLQIDLCFDLSLRWFLQGKNQTNKQTNKATSTAPPAWG